MATEPFKIDKRSNAALYITEAAKSNNQVVKELESVIELLPSVPFEVSKHLYFAINSAHKTTQWLDRTGVPEYAFEQPKLIGD